jgi:hypothetical protein
MPVMRKPESAKKRSTPIQPARARLKKKDASGWNS